ncbi:MAG: SagB/ThcOx family dehydrogenase [Candidatus Eremiobacteraeota bacterium]|nr:SagB/ThcOx family dehydrogenase [Candidatus Eremiobacteraeota bacterium]
MEEKVGDLFQRETVYSPRKMAGGFLDWSSRPESYKIYQGAKTYELPKPQREGGVALHDLLSTRRSIRSFSSEALSAGDLSYLLWASTGISHGAAGYEFRTAPSAGALYPIETYLAAVNIEGIPPGIYHYRIKEHLLEEIREERSTGQEIAGAALGQEMCAEAPATFVWTAVFFRSKWKYRERAYRYIYMDAGHIAGNLALAAVALDLGSCQIGAFYDDEMNKIIGVDGDGESVIYLSAVGHPSRSER